MQQKRIYNTLSTVGQISVGLQGMSCLGVAAALLIMGGMFLGSQYDLAPAVVDRVQCTATESVCGVGVTYTYKGKSYMGTFETMRVTSYSPGDLVYIRVNPSIPTSISEDLPWRSIGLGMMSGAIALGFLAWYAIHLVSDDKNMAALAGSLSLLRIAV